MRTAVKSCWESLGFENLKNKESSVLKQFNIQIRSWDLMTLESYGLKSKNLGAPKAKNLGVTAPMSEEK